MGQAKGSVERHVAIESLALLRANLSAIPRRNVFARVRAADMLAHIDRLVEAHLAMSEPHAACATEDLKGSAPVELVTTTGSPLPSLPFYLRRVSRPR
jgi:hypothetical protein